MTTDGRRIPDPGSRPVGQGICRMKEEALVLADLDVRAFRAVLLPAGFREQLANLRRLLVAQNLRARQPVAKRCVLVELPDDLLVACDFEDLRALLAGMAIAHD